MQIINPLMIMPEPDEILDFKQVFGCEFGDRGRYKKVFGNRGLLAENPKAVCIRFNSGGPTKKPERTTGLRFDPLTGELVTVEIISLIPRLKQNTDYYVTHFWTKYRNDYKSTPFPIEYIGSTSLGFTQGLSELADAMELPLKLIVSTEPWGMGEVFEGTHFLVDADQASQEPTEPREGFPMDLGMLGGKGTFIPDN